MKQGPAHTPKHNSVAERYNRTIMERCGAQMIHAALPKRLWGEILLATSHVLNMSPTCSGQMFLPILGNLPALEMVHIWLITNSVV